MKVIRDTSDKLTYNQKGQYGRFIVFVNNLELQMVSDLLL